MNLVSTSLEFFKSEGKVREYCFLNQQPIELISADEAKKTFKKINVFIGVNQNSITIGIDARINVFIGTCGGKYCCLRF